MDNKQIKYGYIPDKIEKDHFVYGASPLPQIVLRPDGQWLDYFPKEEDQRKQIETYNCTSFNTLNAVEILFEEVLKLERNFSDRFTGITADTKPPGNSPHTVAQAIRHYGLIDELLLPFSPELKSAEEYYAPNPLPDNLLKEGEKFLTEYEIGHEWVFSDELGKGQEIERMKKNLQLSPLAASVYAWQPDDKGIYVNPNKEQDTHWTCVAGYNEGRYWIIFDSYAPYVKHLAWDFPFGQVKRYHIAKKEIPVITEPLKKNNWFLRIGQSLKSLWRRVVDPGSLGTERSGGWATFRRIYIKDYCELCETKKSLLKPLELHHIRPFHNHPELELEPTNMITVCRFCHLRYAHLGSFQSYCLEIKELASEWRERRENRP